MNRRRTRYRFTIDGTEYHTLAYSQERAEAWMHRLYPNASVVYLGTGTGRAPRAADRPPQAFAIDQAALAEAIALLGIKLPVHVKITAHGGRTMGTHRFRAAHGTFMRDPERDTASGGMVHAIAIRSWLGVEEAGRTLWHELTHAMQAERETASATTMREQFEGWRFCAARGRGITYRAKPIEVEARDHEPLNDDLPLAVPA